MLLIRSRVYIIIIPVHTNKVSYTVIVFCVGASKELEHQRTFMDLDDDFGTELEEDETVIDDE